MSVIRRAPFTFAFETAILAVAFWNGSAVGRLSGELRRAWGFAPLEFWPARWHSLATNTFLVRNAMMLLGMVLFVAASVGVYEWRAGTGRAFLCFWLVNVFTLVVIAACVAAPMRLAGVPQRWDWAPAGDVGASFGGFGCLGAWMAEMTGRRRRLLLFAAVSAALVAKFLLLPEIFGDSGHVVAFYAGALLGLGLRTGGGTVAEMGAEPK